MTQMSWGVVRIYNYLWAKLTEREQETKARLLLFDRSDHILHSSVDTSTPGVQEDVLSVTAAYSHHITIGML